MISFIKSSSIVARKVSLGCSISGTTSSRIFATLQITMKSFCVYKDKISVLWISESDKKVYTLLWIWGLRYYECQVSVKKKKRLPDALLLMFILGEREREREWVSGAGMAAGEGGRGKQRIPSRFCAVSAQPNSGLDLMNCEIMTWHETKSRTLNWATQVPRKTDFRNTCPALPPQPVKCPPPPASPLISTSRTSDSAQLPPLKAFMIPSH